MTLKQLEYFDAIATVGNMTKAAQMLHISQPPLSIHLKALEEELGVTLFERNKKKLILTKEGLVLKERVDKILNLVNSVYYDLQNMQVKGRAVIQIGTIMSASNRMLPNKIMEYKQNHVNVDFQIHEGSSMDVLEKINSNTIDIGFVREPIPTSAYHCISINDPSLPNTRNDCFTTLALPQFFEDHEGDEITLLDLKGKPLIIQRRYSSMISNECRHLGFAPHFICQNNDLMSSLSWAACGIGIAVIPYTSALLNTHEEMQIKKIVEPELSSQTLLVYKKEKHITPELADFISLFSGPGETVIEGKE
ncbi:MAG: LysR family transcriptional regulator [Lachnospiraceae bacterium]|nr:LysR family transcriptional regulator [Lachnospiraceae bacterium]